MAALARLTPAERRVLALIAGGLTSAAIAETQGISPKTVENHRQHICGKLGLHGPQALLRFALEHKAFARPVAPPCMGGSPHKPRGILLIRASLPRA